MDIQFFKGLFKKYFDKYFESLEIIENKFKENSNVIEFESDGKIYYNKIELTRDKKIMIKNTSKTMLYNEFIIEDNVNVDFLIQNTGELYIYNLYHIKSKSKLNIREKIYNAKKIIAISKIYIPEESKESEGYLYQILYDENSISILLPIIDIRNNTSKGFHGSKKLKLSNEEIKYLKFFTLDENRIKELLLKDFINI
ncbi:MAG: hypothetical protein ACP5G1_02460 [Nanopusillaceae archaeon]